MVGRFYLQFPEGGNGQGIRLLYCETIFIRKWDGPGWHSDSPHSLQNATVEATRSSDHSFKTVFSDGFFVTKDFVDTFLRVLETTRLQITF